MTNASRRCAGSEETHLVRQPKLLALVFGVLAALALASCSGGGSAFEELEQVAAIERGTPTLVFIYTDG